MQSNCLASKNLLVNVGLDNANGKVKYLSTYVFIRGCGWAANLSWLAFVHIPRRDAEPVYRSMQALRSFRVPAPLDAQTVKKPGPKTLRFVMQTTLSLARLNPLVNLDTVILLSGGARQYADSGFAF